MIEEKKIFVIVAKTVQNPLYLQYLSEEHDTFLWTVGERTKTIIQPVGRIAAQVAHVVSRMRTLQVKAYGHLPYTTIILSVPDSFNLEFRYRLLLPKTETYTFYDSNDEYGSDEVLTAICTVPIEREKLYGAIDYLPLWDGKTD